MTSRRGRVILAGYSPDLPDLVCVRALERALASGLIVAPRDLPKDLGNRSTIWLDQHEPMNSHDEIWQQVTETLRQGQNVLRWFPETPLATASGRKDADALRDAGIPIELVPTIPIELTAATFAGVPLPETPRVLAMSGTGSGSEITITTDPETCDDSAATLTIQHPGTPRQSTDGSQVPAERRGTLLGGNCAERRLRPNWFESLPLFGQRILVTRTIAQAPVLSRTLRELGAEPVELPAIDIIPDPFPEQTRKAVDDLPDYDWVVFTSTNGVQVFMESVRQAGYDARRFSRSLVAAIGTATAERLRRHFIEPDVVPDEFVAESLLDRMRGHGLQGTRVLIPRAETARKTLPDGLTAEGATVDVVPVYRTIPGTPDPAVIDRLDAGEIDIVTFTSSSTVTNLVDMLGGDVSRLSDVRVACIGPITAGTARDHGLDVSIIATEYTIPGLIDALCSTSEEGAND